MAWGPMQWTGDPAMTWGLLPWPGDLPMIWGPCHGLGTWSLGTPPWLGDPLAWQTPWPGGPQAFRDILAQVTAVRPHPCTGDRQSWPGTRAGLGEQVGPSFGVDGNFLLGESRLRQPRVGTGPDGAFGK